MNRISWIDNLRGMSILAVIFLHSTIAVNGNAGHLTGLSHLVNEMMGPIRLGLMFFISGLFVESGLRFGKKIFLKNKVKSILYPFAVWVAIYGGLKLLFNRVSNNPQSAENILLSHLTGGGDITWFLHSLFLFFLIILIIRHLPFYIVIPGFCALSFLLPQVPEGIFSGFNNDHINQSLYLFVFFYLGDLLTRKNIDMPAMAKENRILAGSLLCFIVLSCLNLFLEKALPYQLLTPLALLSIPLFVFIACHTHSRIIHFIGVNSIVFYLSHYLAIQVFAKLVKFTSESLWIHDLKFCMAFLFACFVPLVLSYMKMRGWGVTRLFTLKADRRTPVPATKSIA